MQFNGFYGSRELCRRNFWFRDVDSNHDTQLQRLMSYRLDDPGTGLISVADARKCAQAPQVHGILGSPTFRAIFAYLVIPFLRRSTSAREWAAPFETFSMTCA